MSAAIAHFRTALRGLLRRPLASSSIVLMLALGLGFNTAFFAVVEAVLLQPLPYYRPDRVMLLWTGRNADATGGVNSYADFLQWKAATRSFQSLAAYNISFGTLTGRGDPEEVSGSAVTPEFFHVLRPTLLLGRGLEPGDELIGVESVRPIVISHSLWLRRFGGDPGITNQTLTLGGRQRQIVGVLAAGFRHPEPFWGAEAEYWTPMLVDDDMRVQHGLRYLRVIGRLTDGVTLAAARSELDAIGRRLMTEHPITNERSVVVAPVHDELVGNARPLSLVFFAATVLVLSLVVVNVVNLLLARMSHRDREFAVRTALGAGPGRLAAQVLAESIVLGLAGGVAGLLLAQFGVRLAMTYGPGNLAGIESTHVTLRVLLFSFGLAVTTGLLCGLAPAVRLIRARTGPGADVRGTTGVDVSRRRTLIVASEVALAVPLVLGAVLLARTLVTLQQVDPGFNASQALHFRVNLSAAAYEPPARRVAFFDSLTDALRALPGTKAAGAASSIPLGGLNNTGGSVVYERADGSLAQTGVGTRYVTGEYFEAIGVPIRQGRFVADPFSIVINERAAATLWPGEHPIGRRLRVGALADPPGTNRWLTVTGVIADIRHDALSRPANAEVYQPFVANPLPTMTVVMRSDRDLESLAPAIRSTVAQLDPALAVVGLGTVGAFVEGQLQRPRFGAMCALVFGALGLILAAGGTFAVMWLLVAQRSKEIGIRMALGATPGAVGALVIRQSMTPALIGLLAGALAAAWLGRSLESVLVGVSAHDPGAFTATIVVVLVVALLASWLPAWRAMRTNPVVAMKGET